MQLTGPPELRSSSHGCDSCRRNLEGDGTLRNLHLGLIGNCSVSALINQQAQIVWCCLPRFDGDPVFHALLGAPEAACDDGVFSIEIENQTGSSQVYVDNTAILRTTLQAEGGAIEVTDFCPRFYIRDRVFRPQMLVRRIVPTEGNPRIRIRVRPPFDYGARVASIT